MTSFYLLRRAILAATLVLVAASAALWVARLAPGDFVTQSLGTTGSPTEAAQMRARLGLDRPPLAQYGAWLMSVARLDFGTSFVDGRPVRRLIVERGFNTALLGLVSLLIATLLGVTLGTLSGSRPDGLMAGIVSPVSIAILSMPPLLTSLLLAVIAARTRWLPIGGMHSPTATGILDVAWHMVAPVCALALPVAASFERIHSRAIQETLRQPFLIGARARGVDGPRLLWRAALRPSLRSIASMYGVAAAALFSGSFAVEVVTAWPGLGRLMVDALLARDLYVVAGCAFAGALCLAVATFLADAALVLVDPQTAD